MTARFNREIIPVTIDQSFQSVTVPEKGFKITVLADNNADAPLEKEHGFAALASIGETSILFDAGQGEVLFKNADILGVNLTDIDMLVISHGHYDHTGGVSRIISKNPSIAVFAHDGILAPHFSMKNPAQSRDISMTLENRQALLDLPAGRFYRLKSPLIGQGIGLTGAIPRDDPMEDAGGAFTKDRRGREKDIIEEETALWLKTGKGLVILTGCCHAGFINTCAYVRKLSGQEKIHAVIGGFHLQTAGRERISATSRFINQTGIDSVVGCHCTGDDAIHTLERETSGKVKKAYSGWSVTYAN